VRFVILGAGGIGGVIGARLHQSGHAVALIARGRHLDVIRERGLRIESADETATLRIPVAGHPSEVGLREGDVVLLAVKSQDTREALASLRASAPDAIPVVCAQNGVANEREAARWFENVYALCVMCPTAHLVPGVVQAYSSPTTGILDVGRHPTGVDDVSRALAAALARSTFASEPRPDVMRWKYAKLLMNLGNAIEALCGPHARAGELAQRVEAEGVACLRAAGIDFASREEDRARRGEILRLRPIGGARRGGGSTWQSLERQSGSVETDYLNGEIVLLGRLHGVPTPANALLQRTMARAARELWTPGSLAPEALLAQLPGHAPARTDGSRTRRPPTTPRTC
jgi:2-dehydropantoate 2-reductase